MNRIICICKSVTTVVLCVFLMMLFSENVLADEQIYFDEEGNLIYITYDKKATSSVSYKAIGWIIKRYDAPMNAPGQQYVIVRKIEYAVDDPDNPGYLYCYFWSDRDEILDAVEKVSEEWRYKLETYGDTVYIDNVMTVCNSRVPLGNVDENGKCTGEVYYTLEGITNARGWAQPQYLKAYFDIILKFPSQITNEPIAPKDGLIRTFEVEYREKSDLILGSNAYGEEIYDVSEAMPAGEDVYFKGMAGKYICKLKCEEHSMTVYVPVEVKTCYIRNWIDMEGNKVTESQTVSRWYNIPKEITYTVVNDVEVLGLRSAIVKSSILNDTVGLYSQNKQDIECDYTGLGEYKSRLDYSSYSCYSSDVILSSNNYIKPTIPDDDYYDLASNVVSTVYVRSDGLKIDYNVVLSSAFMPDAGDKVSEAIDIEKIPLYVDRITTVDTLKNGLYDDVEMRLMYKSASTGEHIVEANGDINNACIHTPVLCKGEIYGEKSSNQAVRPASNDIALGGKMYVSIDCYGEHIGSKGYGINDYSRYVKESYVKCPFPVKRNGILYEANSWLKLDTNITEFELPEDVPLGAYSIECRVVAKNGDINDDFGRVINGDMEQYGAYGTTRVNVIGRLMDLQLKDGQWYRVGIKDYKGKTLAGFYNNLLPRAYELENGMSVPISIKSMGNLSANAKLTANISYYYVQKGESKTVPLNVMEGESTAIIFDRSRVSANGDNTFTWYGDLILPDTIKQMKDCTVFVACEFILDNGSLKRLAYINESNYRRGYCNMWKTQGGAESITLPGLRTYIEDGTVLMISIEGLSREDYIVNGTH